jgi:hypothetical protein
MIQILQVGRSPCEHCKTDRPVKGVLVRCHGGHIEPEPLPDDGTRRLRFRLQGYIWPEELFLCLRHLAHLLRRLIGDPISWHIQVVAAEKPERVNTTYEEARDRGWSS